MSPCLSWQNAEKLRMVVVCVCVWECVCFLMLPSQKWPPGRQISYTAKAFPNCHSAFPCRYITETCLWQILCFSSSSSSFLWLSVCVCVSFFSSFLCVQVYRFQYLTGAWQRNREAGPVRASAGRCRKSHENKNHPVRIGNVNRYSPCPRTHNRFRMQIGWGGGGGNKYVSRKKLATDAFVTGSGTGRKLTKIRWDAKGLRWLWSYLFYQF